MAINENLKNFIFEFLSLKDIMMFSFTSKHNYNLVHSNNVLVNNLWKQSCFRTYYPISSLFHQSNSINSETMIWRTIYIEMSNNKRLLNVDKYESASTLVYDAIKTHLYVPHLRKINHVLENNFNSAHQIFFYDYIREENDIYEFYNNYFNSEDENDKFVRDDSLILQKYIINFETYTKEVKNSKQDCNILNSIFNYDFSFINSNIKTNNEVLYFAIWLYQTFIVLSHMMLLNLKEKETNSKAFLSQFSNDHSFYVDIALTLNEKLENINVIINYMFLVIFNKEVSIKKFSIYKMLLNIWFNEVYNNLSNSIAVNFDSVVSLQLDNDNISLIEQVVNSVLDFSIDEQSVTLINHTDLPTMKNYDLLEDKLITSICVKIKNQINTIANIDEKMYLDVIEKIKAFKLINRTKVKLLESISVLYNEVILKRVSVVFYDFLMKPSVTQSNQTFYYNNEYPIIQEKIKHEMTMLHSFLKNKYTMVENIDELIDTFFTMAYPINQFIGVYLNKYYETLLYYQKGNNKIIKTVKTHSESSTSCLYSHGILCSKNDFKFEDYYFEEEPNNNVYI